MFVRRAYIPEALRPGDFDSWPYTVPAVAELARDGLQFRSPVTFLVGDNGSGKSTLVEAIAEGFKLDARGGRAAARTGRPDPTLTPLGEVLRLETTSDGARMLSGPRLKKKGFFLRAETAFSMTENLGGVPGYWDEDTATMSHGEGFLAVFRSMFADSGFYVMHDLGESGAQVVCATHSPILAAMPGADIIEIGEHGMCRTKWDDLDIVDRWRRYLTDPGVYLRHITDE